MHKYWLLTKRELYLLLGNWGRILQVAIFYLIIVTLYVFAVGSNGELYQTIGMAIIWISAFLAIQLSGASMLQPDYEDGTLELYWLHAYYPEMIILIKIIIYWCVVGLFLALLSPLLIVLLQMTKADTLISMLSLAMGVLGLVSLNVLGASLTLGARQAGLLQPLVLLPLAVPLLIFGVAASQGNEQAFYVISILAFMYLIIALIAGGMTLTMIIREG